MSSQKRQRRDTRNADEHRTAPSHLQAPNVAKEDSVKPGALRNRFVIEEPQEPEPVQTPQKTDDLGNTQEQAREMILDEESTISVYNSSIEEEDEVEVQQKAPEKPQPPTRRRTVETVFNVENKVFRLSSKKTLVLFDRNERVCFHGYVQVRVIAGLLDVYGYVIHPSTRFHPIFAPYNSHAIHVRPGIGSGTDERTSLVQSDKEDCSIMELLREYGPGRCCAVVFYKQELKPNASDKLCSLPPPKKKTQDLKNPLYNKLHVEVVTEDTGAFQILQIPQEWKNICEKITPRVQTATIVICGTKGSGKSILGRYLTNFLLNFGEAAFLDLDLGQAEFTCPGFVSLSVISPSDPLLGPSWTHLRPPLLSYFVGETTPERDPQYYSQCTLALMKYYTKNLRGRVPLVVNTHGWVKSKGYELLMECIGNLVPSDIVQIGKLPNQWTPDVTYPLQIDDLANAGLWVESIDCSPSAQNSPAQPTGSSTRHVQTTSVPTTPKTPTSATAGMPKTPTTPIQATTSSTASPKSPSQTNHEGSDGKPKNNKDRKRKRSSSQEPDESEERRRKPKTKPKQSPNQPTQQHQTQPSTKQSPEQQSQLPQPQQSPTTNQPKQQQARSINSQSRAREPTSPCVLYSVVQLTHNAPRITTSPHDERLLRILTYFRVASNARIGADISYTVPWRQLRLKFMESIPPSQAFYALNATVVALLADTTKYKTHNPKLKDSPFPSFLLAPLRPIHCVGLGIIKAIDFDQQTITIVTPVPFHELQHVNTLVRGRSELPSVLLFQETATDMMYITSDSIPGKEAAPFKHRAFVKRAIHHDQHE